MPSMARWLTTCAVVVALAGSAPGLPAIRAQSAPPWLPLEVVTRAASTRGVDARRALDQLAEQWRPGYAPMLLDLAEFSRAPFFGAAVDFSELNVGFSAVGAESSFQGLPDLDVPDVPRPDLRRSRRIADHHLRSPRRRRAVQGRTNIPPDLAALFEIA